MKRHTTQEQQNVAGELLAKQVAVIGAGTLGSALIQALLEAGLPASNLRATVRHRERTVGSGPLTILATRDNLGAVRGADIVLVCLKPQYVRQVLEQIAPELQKDVLLVSMATGVSSEIIEACLRAEIAVVRAMPNTACRIGKGMTVLSRGRHAGDSAMQTVITLFQRMGRTVEADEQHMDAVTALSASGPAFIFTILEAMAEGGVRVGLPRELATLLAAEATAGAAAMVLETRQHPALLKSEVTTPGGCTVDGTLELEDGKIRASLIRAISTTAKKAARLAASEERSPMQAQAEIAAD